MLDSAAIVQKWAVRYDTEGRAKAAIMEIAKRAGVRSGDAPVVFLEDATTPPTLQWVKKGKVLKRKGGSRKQTHKKGTRRVVVGRAWLQDNAPELWAAFMAARLHGFDRHIPTTLREESE